MVNAQPKLNERNTAEAHEYMRNHYEFTDHALSWMRRPGWVKGFVEIQTPSYEMRQTRNDNHAYVHVVVHDDGTQEEIEMYGGLWNDADGFLHSLWYGASNKSHLVYWFLVQ